MNDTLAGASSVQPVRPLPKPGAWVARLACDDIHPQVAKVRDVYPEHNALDLIFYRTAPQCSIHSGLAA
jgi:hypothetical protein